MPCTSVIDLPDELLMRILSHATTPSFILFTLTCQRLFTLAEESRHVVLQHLRTIPGIKLGLDDRTVSTKDLFLLLRQRASKNLYGAPFISDCTEFKYRNGTIDVDASSMAEMGADYVTMSIVLKNSRACRLYGSKCALKEKIAPPYADGLAKILQVVHRKYTISILYQFQRYKSPLPEFEKPLVTKTVAEQMAMKMPDLPPDYLPSVKTPPPKIKYHLWHFNAYTNDKPYLFGIDVYKDLVPVHLAVSSRLQCAILWDKPDQGTIPSESAEIIYYSASKCPINEEGVYDARVIWPTPTEIRPPPVTPTDIVSGRAPLKPKKISFYKEGRRLKMFEAGGTVPYAIIATGPTYDSRAGNNQVAFENGTFFDVDTPFYGRHETYTDILDDQTYCNMSHLCLAVADVGLSTKCKILCILRSKSRFLQGDCGHTVDLSRMVHVSAQNCKAVARLWGWREISSSLTGLETVSISKNGTRIAIAMWNEVYVWSIDPKMLCEEIDDMGSDSEGRKDSKSASKKKKARKRKIRGVADDFYKRRKDNILGWRIAEPRPVVLDLGDAVARKMSWSMAEDEEEDSEEDSEAEVESEEDNHAVDTSVQDLVVSNSEVSQDTAVETPIPQMTPNTETDMSPAGQKAATEPTGDIQQAEFADNTTATMAKEKALADNASSNEYTEKATSKPKSRINSPQPPVARTPQVTMSEQKSSDPDAKTVSSPSQQTITAPSQPTDPIPSIQLVVDPPPIPSPLANGVDHSHSEPKGKEREHEPPISGEPASQSSSSTPSKLQDSTEPQSQALIITTISTSTSSSSTIPAMSALPKSSSTSTTTQPITISPTPSSKTQVKAKKHRKRHTEDELVVMTDRGVQVWDLGPWGRGRRKMEWLGE